MANHRVFSRSRGTQSTRESSRASGQWSSNRNTNGSVTAAGLASRLDPNATHTPAKRSHPPRRA